VTECVEVEVALEAADGVNVAAGLDTHELAAANAADVEVDASGLTVPLPAKLQAIALRFWDS
jgi:hypothetical protein